MKRLHIFEDLEALPRSAVVQYWADGPQSFVLVTHNVLTYNL